MPYEATEVDVKCNATFCGYCSDEYCDVDENVEDLTLNDFHKCRWAYLMKEREYFPKTTYELDNLMNHIEDGGYLFTNLNPDSNRIVMKAQILKKDGVIREKAIVRVGFFKVNKEDEKEYYFFPHVDGGISAMSKLVASADLFGRDICA